MRSIRHTTRNFPNREGSKIQNGRFLLLHLWMHVLSQQQQQTRDSLHLQRHGWNTTGQKYYFDKTIYENRVFDSKGVADPSVEIQFGPNIKDWPAMAALPQRTCS